MDKREAMRRNAGALGSPQRRMKVAELMTHMSRMNLTRLVDDLGRAQTTGSTGNLSNWLLRFAKKELEDRADAISGRNQKIDEAAARIKAAQAELEAAQAELELAKAEAGR